MYFSLFFYAGLIDQTVRYGKLHSSIIARILELKMNEAFRMRRQECLNSLLIRLDIIEILRGPIVTLENVFGYYSEYDCKFVSFCLYQRKTLSFSVV